MTVQVIISRQRHRGGVPIGDPERIEVNEEWPPIFSRQFQVGDVIKRRDGARWRVMGREWDEEDEHLTLHVNEAVEASP